MDHGHVPYVGIYAPKSIHRRNEDKELLKMNLLQMYPNLAKMSLKDAEKTIELYRQRRLEDIGHYLAIQGSKKRKENIRDKPLTKEAKELGVALGLSNEEIYIFLEENKLKL